MKETIKPATKEDVAEQTKTKQKSEEEKKKEDEEELIGKANELAEKEARLNGGFSRALGRNYVGIDLELDITEYTIQLKQIEMEQFIPLTPYWRYELDETWLALQKKGLLKDLDMKKESFEKIKQQKEELLKLVPELKKKINELQKKMGKEVINFDEKKTE